MFSLSLDTMIRPEENAALLLQKQTMETCMLSRDGLLTLNNLCNGLSSNNGNEEANKIAKYLLNNKFIVNSDSPSNKTVTLLNYCIIESQKVVAPLRSLSVPESIHIYVSNICDQSCKGCYYSSSAENPEHFMEQQLFDKIVCDAKKARIFQIALGGGEPLLHKDIVSMVQKIVDSGMICTMTSNGNMLSMEKAILLKEAGLSKIQISMNGDTEEINALTRPNFKQAVAAIQIAGEAGLKTGINYVITKRNLKRFPNLLRKAEEWGCDSFNLLRPKEAYSDAEWLLLEAPDSKDYAWLQDCLKNISVKSPTKVRFDDALSFLMTEKDPDELFENGIWGCVAGRRFLNIDPFGHIYACSHVRESDFGNGDFLLAWKQSKVFESFRILDDYIEGACATCHFKKCCRGCRAVVLAYNKNFVSEDFQCPIKNTECVSSLEGGVSDEWS